jgi:hypothetical protein
LIKELLLWKKWGVITIDEALYKVAFRLLYYGKCELLVFAAEQFEDYPRSWRAKVIKGMLATSQQHELERFACLVLTELSRPERYNRIQRKSLKMMLFKEFGRWQKWGADLSFMLKDLERELGVYIANGDAVGFGTFLKTTGIKLDAVLTKNLLFAVNHAKFKKQHTQKMFFDSINKNRQ